MAIVTDDDVMAAREFLASDELAEAFFRLTQAEHECDRLHAELLLQSNQKSADLRKASVEINPTYVAAKDRLAHRMRNHKAAQQRNVSAERTIAIWQSEGANARHSF